LAYLLQLRLTANVKRAMDRAMLEVGWTQAGQGWQGKEAWLKPHGWGRAQASEHVLLAWASSLGLILTTHLNPM